MAMQFPVPFASPQTKILVPKLAMAIYGYGEYARCDRGMRDKACVIGGPIVMCVGAKMLEMNGI